MRISENYMRTHDIDWFCCLDRRYLLHFASNGSLLPPFVADNWIVINSQRLLSVLPLQPGSELRYNEAHILQLSEQKDFGRERYLESFKFFAQKGCYSFDFEWKRENEYFWGEDFEENNGAYHLIVGPGSREISPDMREYLLDTLPQISSGDIEYYHRIGFDIRLILDQIRHMNR